MTIPKLHVPHIRFNKTALLLIGAGVFFLAVSVFGAVQKHREADVQIAQAASQTKELKDTKTEVKQLEAEVTKQTAEASSQQAKSAAVCNWVKSQQPRYRFTVPPLCQ